MRRTAVHVASVVLAAMVPALAAIAANPQAASAPASGATVNAEECRTCHEDAFTKFQHTPHAGNEGSCESCHKGAAEHGKDRMEGKETPGPAIGKLPADQVSGLCLECHEKGNQVNWMGSMHDRRKVACNSCHSIHSPRSNRAQLKTARDSETCFNCHQQIRAKSLRTSHHPVREGRLECASCHNPHDGSRPKLIKADWITDQCLTCHTEKRGPFLWEHAPVRENCALCHDPHGSNHDKMLVAKQPFLCQRCHLNTRHPGTLYDGSNTLAGAVLSAPGRPTVSNRAIEHACKNCHQNVHGGNAPSGPYLGR